MSLILGMDIWVFIAWILTILAAVLCVLYGVYHQFLKRFGNKKIFAKKNKRSRNKRDE